MPELALSVLDLVPVRVGQTSVDAVASSVSLAERADALGYRRYWLAEHHNMLSVASTNPPVLLGVLAGRTRSIRLGSGGVMLPNHAPFVIAEQFAALEAAAPGRIDLGIGRAPGSDPVITALLRSTGHTSDVDAFPNNVRDIEALLGADGAGLRLATGEEYTVRATPVAAGVPEIWLLGSSDYSAELAGRLGLPYVFAHHFFGKGAEHALELYRSRFTPSEHLDAPRVFLTANAVAAETEEEAMRLAMPQLRQMALLRTGGTLPPMETVESVGTAPTTAQQARLIEETAQTWFVGEAGEVAGRIAAFAERFGIDEVMVSAIAGASVDDPIDRTPARERTLELLAAHLPQRVLAAA